MKLLASLLAAALLIGCTPEEEATGFEVSLSLRDKFGQEASTFSTEETITLQLRVENTGDSAATLNFNNGQAYDFTISNSAGAEIWHWSADKSFTEATESTTFAAGEVRFYSADWDQEDDSNAAVPAGSYRAAGEVTASNLDDDVAKSETDSLTIQ